MTCSICGGGGPLDTSNLLVGTLASLPTAGVTDGAQAFCTDCGPGGSGDPGDPGGSGAPVIYNSTTNTWEVVNTYPSDGPPPRASIAVFMDGGGGALLQETQVYQSVPFDATAKKLIVFTDGDAAGEDAAITVFRQPLSSWRPVVASADRDRVALAVSDDGKPGTQTLPAFGFTSELNADDTLIFELLVTNVVTKVHASLIVERR